MGSFTKTILSVAELCTWLPEQAKYLGEYATNYDKLIIIRMIRTENGLLQYGRYYCAGVAGRETYSCQNDGEN